MIDKLKVLLNTDNEELLQVILDLVEQEFMDYCNREDIPETANTTLINMARVQYARLDSQGLNSTSIGGITEGYTETFYPANLLQQMNRFRKIKTL